MTKRLEYIASGTSYMRLTAKRNFEDANSLAFIIDALKKITNNTQQHNFGVLFNAYTESSFGEKLQHYRPALHSIH
jgi:hypothetical protein